jgi:hypothetical protein
MAVELDVAQRQQKPQPAAKDAAVANHDDGTGCSGDAAPGDESVHVKFAPPPSSTSDADAAPEAADSLPTPVPLGATVHPNVRPAAKSVPAAVPASAASTTASTDAPPATAREKRKKARKGPKGDDAAPTPSEQSAVGRLWDKLERAERRAGGGSRRVAPPEEVPWHF